MKILAIESSCDETSVSVVENGTKILSNVVASSSPIHTKTGGIIPENAARQQIISILSVLQESLIKASTAAFFNDKKNIIKLLNDHVFNEIDAIAVTYGPGLIGSLLVGVETAKTLSYFFNKPLISVNHLVAHIYANWLITEESRSGFRGLVSSNHRSRTTSHPPTLPAIALVVSGGHTDLVLMKNHGSIKWIGGTRDDAAGEAFDKTARLLGLPYPGGPSISSAADDYFKKHSDVKLDLFPRPMINDDNFDFSFSGLKTSVYNYIEGKRRKNSIDIFHLSAQVQEAICDVLVSKCLRAINEFNPNSVLLAGGVSANNRLRDKFMNGISSMYPMLEVHIPPVGLCTDNAAYIGSCAFFNQNLKDWRNVNAVPGLSIND